MEKSYGIEAARAQLGEIADHVRTTGHTIALTRHGRPVAAIGPVAAIKPAQGVEVRLFLGERDPWMCVLPALPRIGDSFLVEDKDGSEVFWTVVNVQWDLRPDEEPSVNVIADVTEQEN